MRATLFDFNGVLVDDERVHLEAFRDVVGPLGIEVPEALYFERYAGFDDVGAFRAMLADAGRAADDASVGALVEAKKPRYMQRIAQALRIFPGAIEIVRRRAAGAPVGIVSGALLPEIHYVLDRMGLRELLSLVISAEETREGKPDPEGYLLARRRLEQRGYEGGIVVVEDSLAGIQAARGAKMRCVAVAHTYAAGELLAAGADAVVPDLPALSDEILDG